MQNGIYTADKVFTGDEWLNNAAIVVKDGYITDLLPKHQLIVPANKHFNCLVPAFIDIQIYGADEKLFSVYQNVEAIDVLYQHCSNNKTQFFLPTIATNTKEVIVNCIDAIKQYWQIGGKGCLGLHIEGPWINAEKRGAHVRELIHQPNLDEVKELVSLGKGVIKMITLAPEVCSKAIIDYLLGENIIVSAGHSNANFEEATASFNNGITTVTHLYNAMSSLQHRELGMVGATFNHRSVMASIIPDGFHVHFEAIKIAKKQMQERLFVITDAVTTTTKGHYQHVLQADKYVCNQILSGSALTMPKAIDNLVNYCNIELSEALRMCSFYPAKVLGLQNELGKIEKGFKAAIVEW